MSRDFFGASMEQQYCYERANEMLDDCLEIVWSWIREHRLELEELGLIT